MLLWCSLSGGLPTYSRDVLLTALNVVQYQQHMTAAYTILNSLSLSITQMSSGIPQYLLIRPNIKRKRKTWGKQKSRFITTRDFTAVLFGIFPAHSGRNPGGIKCNTQPLIPLKLHKSTKKQLFTPQLIHLFQSGYTDSIFTMVFCLQWHIRKQSTYTQFQP